MAAANPASGAAGGIVIGLPPAEISMMLAMPTPLTTSVTAPSPRKG
jgi:hypothetical protein